MRQRGDTISNLGRAPARQPVPPPKRPPPDPAERGAVRRWIHDALFENVGLKFLSLVLAITVFLLVNTDRDREITARVGVSYTLPDDKVLVSDRLEEVRVTIKGPWQRLRRFDEREIDRVNIDLRRARNGDFTITPDLIALPSGLTITSISPRTVPVAFDRRVDKLVEVTPQLAGRPLHGYVVSEVKPAPATIKVRGAESTLNALSAVRTNEVSVDGRAENFTVDTKVVTPDGVEAVGSNEVLIQVTIDEQLVTRRLLGIPVHVAGEGIDPQKWSVSPPQIDVTLTGSLLTVEKAKAALAPVVRLSGNDTKPREIAVSIDGLPPGIGVRISPERVKISPNKAAPPPAPTRAPSP